MADKPFSEREMEIMAKAWLCMNEQPKIDYKALATACGMTNPGSASNAWANIKKKILARNGPGVAATPTKSPSKKRAKSTVDHADADDDEEGGASPTKKQKTPAKGGRGKKGKKEEENGADATKGSESPIKKEQSEVEGEDEFI